MKVGDKVRVEFNDVDGLIEGRVEVVHFDGDIRVLSHPIFAGTNPEAYKITVLESSIEVGEVIQVDRIEELSIGSVVEHVHTKEKLMVLNSGVTNGILLNTSQLSGEWKVLFIAGES